MANAMKKCRNCGNEYKACRTAKTVSGAFRWQDVACSPECGSAYLARIEESRSSNSKSVETEATTTKRSKKKFTVTEDSLVGLEVNEQNDQISERFYEE